MPMLLLFVGKTKEGFIKDGIAKYLELLRRQTRIEVREIKGSRKTGAEAVREEGEAILERVAPSDYLIALHERGKNPDSQKVRPGLSPAAGTGPQYCFRRRGPVRAL